MKDIQLSTEQQIQLQTELKSSTNVHVYRRAAALLAVHEGRPVSQVAAFLGVTRQSIYNWLVTYVQVGQSIALTDAPRAGRPCLWAGEWDELLRETLRHFPVELGYQERDWNAGLLQEHLAAQLGKRISEETLRRQLRRLGYVWKHGRYVEPRCSDQEVMQPTTSAAIVDERQAVAA